MAVGTMAASSVPVGGGRSGVRSDAASTLGGWYSGGWSPSSGMAMVVENARRNSSE